MLKKPAALLSAVDQLDGDIGKSMGEGNARKTGPTAVTKHDHFAMRLGRALNISGSDPL